MKSLILVCWVVLGSDVTFGQPPAPAPGPAFAGTEQDMMEEMLAFIYVAHGPQKMEQARKHFESQSPSQIRVIHRIYQQQLAQAQASQQQLAQYQQQMLYNQAVLNRDRLTAYRDHLKREYDAKIAQKKLEAEVMRRGTVMAQAMANRMFWGGGYGYRYGGYRGRYHANGRYPNGRLHYGGVSVHVRR